MSKRIIEFCRGGIPLTVNADLIANIQPSGEPGSEEIRTDVHVFGKVYKVRGNHEKIKSMLGWENAERIGFPADMPNPAESLPAATTIAPIEVPVTGTEMTQGLPATIGPDVAPAGDKYPVGL